MGIEISFWHALKIFTLGISLGRINLLFAGITLSLGAIAQVPDSVVDSCVLLEGVDASVQYKEIGGIGAFRDDEIPGYSLLNYDWRGVEYGCATSQRGSRDLIIVGRHRLPIGNATPIGEERPAPLDSAQAAYSVVRYQDHDYYCVASNFEGLGRSGSFQNVRQTYIAPLVARRGSPRMHGLYYAVRDIRRIERVQR